MLLRCASELCPALSNSYPEDRISMWMGHRPEMPDSLPVIGPSPKRPNVFYAFGHGHTGLTFGPTTGRLIADLVAGRPPSLDLSPFTIARFG